MKRIVLIFVNIVLPIILGGFIYIVYRPDTYISKLFFLLINTSHFSISFDNELVDLFFCNYLSDILWAYSLTSSLLIVCGKFKNKSIIILAISILFEILFEVLQTFNVIKGTGDFLDVVFMGMASVIAVIIEKKLWEVFYEKENY